MVSEWRRIEETGGCKTYREGEIKRLGCAKVSRKQCVEVPRDQRIDDNIEEEEQERIEHCETVVNGDRCIEGRPLYSNT